MEITHPANGQKIEVLFFGRNQRAGHFLWIDDHRTAYSNDSCKMKTFNTGKVSYYDGSDFILPRPEVVGTGAITFFPHLGCTVLAWWGSPFDRRGAVNNSIIITGYIKSENPLFAIWELFEQAFPILSKKLTKPEIVQYCSQLTY